VLNFTYQYKKRNFVLSSFKTHREIFHSQLANYLGANKRNLNEIKCRIRKSIKERLSKRLKLRQDLELNVERRKKEDINRLVD